MARLLQVDEEFGEVFQRHLARLDIGDDAPAVEHDEPVRQRMHMGEVVLDIDAGAPGAP